MKGLYRYLSPFAPDQSGAVSVLYELGGLLVIIDAGGCAGNVCGFDEPRWFTGRSAVFSAGLRDMDAILGRDSYLLDKIGDALHSFDAAFIGLIGTPVPAVIATDYLALKRMAEKRFRLPVVTVDTNGMEDYVTGQEKAWRALFSLLEEAKDGRNSCAADLFARAPQEEAPVTGVFGASPLDLPAMDSPQRFSERLRKAGYDGPACYGFGAGLGAICRMKEAKHNIVAAPGGLWPARLLKEKCGIPYTSTLLLEEAVSRPREEGGKTLILHQQVFANSLRKALRAQGHAGEIRTASFFRMDKAEAEENDVQLAEEDDLIRLVRDGGFETIYGDPLYRRALPEFRGHYFRLPHYAVSGNLFAAEKEEAYFANMKEDGGK